MVFEVYPDLHFRRISTYGRFGRHGNIDIPEQYMSNMKSTALLCESHPTM